MGGGIASQDASACVVLKQVVNESCPRYVIMGTTPMGMGHQLGTLTSALVVALFFDLTLVTNGFKDKST